MVVDMLELDVCHLENNIQDTILSKSLERGDRTVLKQVFEVISTMFLDGLNKDVSVLEFTQRLFRIILICYYAKTIDNEKFREQFKNMMLELNEDQKTCFVNVCSVVRS